jgi:clathrin heavy chain
VVSKHSFLSVFELTTASLLFRSKVCNENIFVGTANSKTGGYYVIGKEGVVYSINVVEEMLVNHILNQCRHIPDVMQLAFKLASRYKLPGVDNMFVDQFNRLLVAGDVVNASKIAASAPGTLLRNPETIAKFKQIPQ